MSSAEPDHDAFSMWSTKRATTRALTAVTAVLTVVLIGSSLSVSDKCNGPTPPVAHPEPGTPLADYCSVMHSASTATFCVLLPLLAFGAGAALLRRRVGPIVVLAVVIGVLSITNFFVMNDLSAIPEAIPL